MSVVGGGLDPGGSGSWEAMVIGKGTVCCKERWGTVCVMDQSVGIMNAWRGLRGSCYGREENVGCCRIANASDTPLDQ